MYPVVIVSPSPSSELDAPEQAARPSPSRPAPPASAARRLRDDVVRGWVRGVITIILHVSAVRFRFPIGHRSFVSINRSEEHTSELQSRGHRVCRLLLEKKKQY